MGQTGFDNGSMSTEVPLPTGSYVTNDPRGSSKRLVGCFSEAMDTTSPTDSKAKVPPVMLRRAPGIAAFGAVSSVVASITAAQAYGTTGFTAGVPATTKALVIDASSDEISTSLSTVETATYGSNATVAGLTLSATTDLTTTGSGVGSTDGGFGYYDGTTGQDFSAFGAIGRSVLDVVGTTNYLGVYYTDDNATPVITAGTYMSGANTYVGYDSGVTGSVTGASMTIGTLVGAFYLYSTTGGAHYYYEVSVLGASSAPAQSTFSSVTDGAGHTYTSSSATYSTSGNYATWRWTVAGLLYTTSSVYDVGFTIGSSTQTFMLQVTGSASAPSKSSFGTVSWTDNNGAQSKNSSAATYSTSGNTATWSWSYSYGTYNVSPFTNGIIFTFTDVASAVGYDTGTSGTGYSSGGSLSSSSIGSLGTLVSIGYGYGAFIPGWYFSIAITGASVAPAQSSLSSVFDGGSNTFYTSSGAIYSTSGTTAYWSWNNRFLSNPWTATDTYDTVFTLGGTYTGFDDGSDAGGEDLPAIGSVGTTTITGVGTLNATYYYYDSVRGNTYLRVIISNTSPPTQSSLTSVQVAVSGTVWPTSSAAYSTYGSAAIWEWLANYGDVIPIAAGNSYDLNFVINSPYIGFDDGTNAGGDTLPAIGSMTGTVSFGTFNSFAYYESGGSYYLQVVITGSATAPAQDAFASIGFRDVTSTARVYYTLDATYATDSKTATWTWGVGAFGFGNADVYDVTMTLSSQPWVGYDDGTITDPGGEGSSFGSITGLPAPFSFSAAINAIEQTVVGLSPNAVTQFQIIATGSAVPPPQYAFSQVTVTDSSSTIIFNLSAAAATYEVNGLSSIGRGQR